MIIYTVDEYIATLALAIHTADKSLILKLDTINAIEWDQVPHTILDQIEDMYHSVDYLFDDD